MQASALFTLEFETNKQFESWNLRLKLSSELMAQVRYASLHPSVYLSVFKTSLHISVPFLMA